MTPDELQNATSGVEREVSKLNEELTQEIADGIMYRFKKYGEVKTNAYVQEKAKNLTKQNESGTTAKRLRTGPINEKDLTANQKRFWKMSISVPRTRLLIFMGRQPITV